MSGDGVRTLRSDLRRRGRLMVLLLGSPGLVVLLLSDVPMRIMGGTALVALCCLWSFVRRASCPPAPEVRPGEGLPFAITASRSAARLLAVAYASLLVGSAAVAVHVLLVPEEPHGRAAGLVVLTLLTLPSAARLARAGRRAWRLELDHSGIRYRGGRREVRATWRELQEVGLDEDGMHLVLRFRGHRCVEVAVPVVAFDIDPRHLARLAESARASA